MRGLISLLSASALVATLAVATLPAAVSAATPSNFFNGFETDTAGWSPNGATITRVGTGDTSTSYASGVPAATGSYYARLGKATTNTTCVNGGGTQDWYEGPYTYWAGASSTFPTGGYSTGVDIYLDVAYAQAHPDTRFDWSSAISDTSGAPRRDFVFNVGTDANGFVINASNNANRCGASPYGSGISVTQSGWYTFRHTFTNVSGVLSVSLDLINMSTTATVGTWVLSDPSDIIGTTVGGNSYGWAAQNEFDGLAIDNSRLAVAVPKCTQTGFYRDGINLTAAVNNPITTVTGSVDATTCNIGVYYGPGEAGTVSADISGANYYGVVVDRAAVDVTSAKIHGIGETQPNGSQHGVGVLYTTFEPTPNPPNTSNTVGTTSGTATGTLSGSTITAYQKNGVVVYGLGAAVNVQNNRVTGYGQIDYIAQNGIEIALGATASVSGNTVSNNYYTPTTYTACGLLFYQAGGVKQSKNVFSGNETNVCNAGRGGGQFSQ